MTVEFSKLEGFKMLKSIDVAEAILYALSAPRRVNVSYTKLYLNILNLPIIIDIA